MYLDALQGGLKLGGASGDENEVGAAGGELLRDRESHAFGCARDEDGLTKAFLSASGIAYARGSRMAAQTLPSTGILLPPKSPIVDAMTSESTAGMRIQSAVLVVMVMSMKEARAGVVEAVARAQVCEEESGFAGYLSPACGCKQQGRCEMG